MDRQKMDPELKREIVGDQRNEITEYYVYRALAKRESDPRNREVLERIAEEERKHYDFWADYTGEKPPPKPWTIWKYVWIARLLGVTFAIKLMEKGEQSAQENYTEIARSIPEAARIAKDEDEHEAELTNMIDEERLQYIGSVVLGLNDALVELTGALAGFTLALQDARLIAVIGLITGVAAALSMAASEYLSTKSEPSDRRSPGKAAAYTGIAYIFTVFLLICPFILLQTPLLSLALTIGAALAVIFAFSYYVSVARGLSLRARFLEMAGLSLGVALVSFGIGYLLRRFTGVEA